MGGLYVKISIFLAVLSSGISSKLEYDHQEETYIAKFKPRGPCSTTCTVTPFFSPDHSVDAYVSMIEEARKNIDLFEPGFSSWSGCTSGKECIGCSLEDQLNERFPVFPALINAASQKNVKVRFLTNDYGPLPTCNDKITPMDWMSLLGMQIRYYRTTTFAHTKFMIIDRGRKILISSVNFSKTSFTKNREAGVIVSDCSCAATELYQDVFNNDFETGYDYRLTRDYSKKEMEFVQSHKRLPPGSMGPFIIKGAFVTRMKPVKGVSLLQGYTSPDYARETFFDGLNSVKHSLKVHIYQITDKEICAKLLDMFHSGIDIRLLLSAHIVGMEDSKEAKDCYKQMYEGGMGDLIQNTYSKFSYSHQKYWIVDDTVVHLSTGNWSPSDFPKGKAFKPYSKSRSSVNRDMLIVMKHPQIVSQFSNVFDEDWSRGMSWGHAQQHQHDEH